MKLGELDDLLKKSIIQKSLSPCVVHTLLTPKRATAIQLIKFNHVPLSYSAEDVLGLNGLSSSRGTICQILSITYAND